MKEIWKDITNYIGLYQVSNLGNVRSLNYLRKGIIRNMKPNPQGKGYKTGKAYLAVGLSKDGKQIYYKVHRLVLQEFEGPSNLQVDHINGITTDNRLENLRYATNRENRTFANLIRTDKSSKYVGVHFCNTAKKFVAKIRIGKERPVLGYFSNEEDAANAYNSKLKELNNNVKT